MTAGLFRPLVLVSTGLRERLRPDVLAVVLAHERAHARRRDPLRLVAAALRRAGTAPAPGGSSSPTWRWPARRQPTTRPRGGR